MGTRIAIEHDTKRGVIGQSRWVASHAMNQAPGKVELEELAQDVDHAVVRIGGMRDAALLFDPVEKVESFLPVVAVTREGVAYVGG